jgi:hypothetical protein
MILICSLVALTGGLSRFGGHKFRRCPLEDGDARGAIKGWWGSNKWKAS